MELDKNSRKYEILCVAVDDFIRTAMPVTSLSLQDSFCNISTATLRNELNSLEAMGFLKQVHTSGGRVPTSTAYKLYVDNVIKNNKLSESKVKKVQQNFEERSINLLSTLTAFAKGLSQITHCPTVLLQKGLENLKIINIQIVPLIKKDALLLVETQAGVLDDSFPIAQDIDRNSCIEASQYLSNEFKDKTIKYMVENINDICLKAGSQIISFKSLIDTVVNALFKVTQKGVNISKDGVDKLYDTLTAEEASKMREMNELLDDKVKITEMIENVENDKLSYSFGDESEIEELRGSMMMTTPIVINGVSIASLALVAPQRVDYASIAAAMKFIASKVKDLEGEDSEKPKK